MFAWLRQIRFSDLSCKVEIFGTISTFFSLLQSYEASITKSNRFAVATAYFSLIHNRNWLVHVHALCCLCLHFASKASSSLPTSSSCSICCVIYNFFSCFEQFLTFHSVWWQLLQFESWYFRDAQLHERGCVTAVQFILFNFANYSPSIAVELKASREITCKWQNQRPETNKYVSWALFLKLQAAGMNFEKPLGWTVFKNLISIRFSLLQFCPSVTSVVSVMLF